MSKILANEIANYGDNAPIDLKEGLNIPAGKPIQAAGLSGTSGQVLSSTGTSINWITPFDGDYTSLTNRPTIPAAQVNADWNATSGVAVILNKPTVPPLTSLVVNSAGTPSLSFNGANGQFTYTPPDLSNYDTAFGWGDHAQAGYLTTETSTFTQVLTRSSTTVTGFGSFGGTAWQANASPTGSNNVLFNNMALFENDVYLNLTGDKVKWGWLSGSMAWCGEGGTFETDWSDEKFELIHWDSARPTGGNYNIQGALYLKSPGGYPISIGNDSSQIQLGSNNGAIKYLSAEPTDAAGPYTVKLFFQNEPVLQTIPLGVELPNSGNLITKGQLRYSNIFGTTALLPLAADHDGMFGTLNDGKAYFSKNIGTTVRVTVGVDTVGGQATGVFYFNGVEKPAAFPIARGSSYTFNQNDSSNATYNNQAHPLMFSLTEDGDLVSGGAHYDPTTTVYMLDGVV